MSADAVLAALPHRPPFLFVDRVVAEGPDTLAVEWTVPPDADFLRGHYPGRPLVPGVILCECAFQAGALLCARDAGQPLAEGAVPVLTRIGEARFKRMVLPGETVRCEVRLDERVGPARWMSAKLSVAGESALRVAFVVALTAAGAAREA